jgi:hypothetical protein
VEYWSGIARHPDIVNSGRGTPELIKKFERKTARETPAVVLTRIDNWSL